MGLLRVWFGAMAMTLIARARVRMMSLIGCVSAEGRGFDDGTFLQVVDESGQDRRIA